jgi:anti-sigma factor RsiW
MSHLGDLLSALVDGELSGTELDRANAHLAACGACRVEARALRRLKCELRSLAEPAGVTDSDQITGRLLAMAAGTGPGAPVPPQRKDSDHGDQGNLGGRRPRRLRAAGRRAGTGPYAVTALGRRAARRRRARYVLWTTLSLVVVGIGTASFGMGGGSTGPKVTPQLEVFDAQHAITSGDVPFANPAELSARVPMVAARP